VAETGKKVEFTKHAYDKFELLGNTDSTYPEPRLKKLWQVHLSWIEGKTKS